MRKKNFKDAFEPIARGVAQSGIRLANERAVMTFIAGRPGGSNADIARFTGLGPQTTARILADLEERQLVERGSVLRGRRGQPATPYQLNPDGAYTLGVEIGWRHSEVLLLSLAGEVLWQRRNRYAFPDAAVLLDRVADDARVAIGTLPASRRGRVLGMSLATPSSFHRTLTRLGATVDQMQAWDGLDIVGELEQRVGLPAIWQNDGNAVAWSEIATYPSQRPPGFACLYVGTYIGAGVVVEGVLWEGPTGNAADIGSSVVVGMDGKPTFPHLVAGLFSLCARLTRAGIRPTEPDMDKWDWPALESVVGPWLDEAAYVLAQAVMTTRAMAEVDLVVIDGEMPREVLGRLLELIRKHLDALPVLGHGLPELTEGHVGRSAAAMGAAQRLFFHTFFSRNWELLGS